MPTGATPSLSFIQRQGNFVLIHITTHAHISRCLVIKPGKLGILLCTQTPCFTTAGISHLVAFSSAAQKGPAAGAQQFRGYQSLGTSQPQLEWSGLASTH